MERTSAICLNCFRPSGRLWWLGFRYDSPGRLVAVWPADERLVNVGPRSDAPPKVEDRLAIRIRRAFDRFENQSLSLASVQAVLSTLSVAGAA